MQIIHKASLFGFLWVPVWSIFITTVVVAEGAAKLHTKKSKKKNCHPPLFSFQRKLFIMHSKVYIDLSKLYAFHLAKTVDD